MSSTRRPQARRSEAALEAGCFENGDDEIDVLDVLAGCIEERSLTLRKLGSSRSNALRGSAGGRYVVDETIESVFRSPECGGGRQRAHFVADVRDPRRTMTSRRAPPSAEVMADERDVARGRGPAMARVPVARIPARYERDREDSRRR